MAIPKVYPMPQPIEYSFPSSPFQRTKERTLPNLPPLKDMKTYATVMTIERDLPAKRRKLNAALGSLLILRSIYRIVTSCNSSMSHEEKLEFCCRFLTDEQHHYFAYEYRLDQHLVTYPTWGTWGVYELAEVFRAYIGALSWSTELGEVNTEEWLDDLWREIVRKELEDYVYWKGQWEEASIYKGSDSDKAEKCIANGKGLDGHEDQFDEDNKENQENEPTIELVDTEQEKLLTSPKDTMDNIETKLVKGSLGWKSCHLGWPKIRKAVGMAERKKLNSSVKKPSKWSCMCSV